MGKYFGTDGFRGEANVTLTVMHAFRIGLYLGWHYGKKHRGKIAIGKDTRRSSYMYEDALSAGIVAAGADAYLLHVTTTPSVAYVVRTEDFDCGVMISASHNPFDDNGIKLINGLGEKMEDSIISAIEDYLDGNWEPPYATGENIGQVVDYSAGRNRYIGYLISLATNSYRGVKVGIDCANGSTWQIAKSVFDALGADTFVINNRPDGLNINQNCGSTHIEGLQRYVVENGLTVGFAFDGDGDRCFAIDEKGKVLNGDSIMYIAARYLRDMGVLKNSRVVTTIMSNMGLYKAFDELGIGYEKTAVGDKNVYDNMVANGNILGGEISGHIIFRRHATTGDGLITAIKIMECMLTQKQSLSQLSEPLKLYPQVLKNIVVTDNLKLLGSKAVENVIRECGIELGDTGRVLVRKSGTEPVVRVMCEAQTTEKAEEMVNKIISAVDSEGLLVEVKAKRSF